MSARKVPSSCSNGYIKYIGLQNKKIYWTTEKKGVSHPRLVVTVEIQYGYFAPEISSVIRGNIMNIYFAVQEVISYFTNTELSIWHQVNLAYQK